MDPQRVLIIIPAFNEETCIAQVVRQLQVLSVRADILVVNDGSTDQTARVAGSAGAKVLTLPFNLGIGGAVQAGYQYALRHGYGIAVQIDGDGQHDTAFLEKLIAPLLCDESDCVIGSRFLSPSAGYRSSVIRRLGIHFFAGLISFLTKVKVTDPTSGFRACNRKTIALFASDYPVDYPEPEAIVVAKKARARVSEVAVDMRERLTGRSSIRYMKTLYYMIKVTFAILLRMLPSENKG
ncbi:MAG TPA: glycosyltransferase family 2 protein [Candidatus Omnitrophota bacterium]|nr:glycosyltransferase family 2 protein [Candidatus Omnitrophota bacterium]HQL41465.1 glycosyltransferase family 2 protein [Candidatus Omnitrophota bacterium]